MDLQEASSPKIEIVQAASSRSNPMVLDNFDTTAEAFRSLLDESKKLQPTAHQNLDKLEELLNKFSEYKKENEELRATVLRLERKTDENDAKWQSLSTRLQSTLLALEPLVQATLQLPSPSTTVPQSSKIPDIIPHDREALMLETPNTQTLKALIAQGNKNLEQLEKGDLDLIITKKLATESVFQDKANALFRDEISKLGSVTKQLCYSQNQLIFFKLLAGGAMCISSLSLFLAISLWLKSRTTS